MKQICDEIGGGESVQAVRPDNDDERNKKNNET